MGITRRNVVAPAPVDEIAAKKIAYFQSLHQLEKTALELYPEESITLAVLRKNHEPVRFFDGFATCRAWGVTLEFPTPSQRWICEVLWTPWQGNSEFVVKMDCQTVLEKAGLSSGGQIEKHFQVKKKIRGKYATKPHEAFGYLIHQHAGVIWMGPPSSAMGDEEHEAE